MFIGGLNWDTTDGTYIITLRLQFLLFSGAETCIRRVAKKVLYTIRQGRGVHDHARRGREVALLRLPDL